MKLSESLLFENTRKTFQSNVVLSVLLVIEFKGLFYFKGNYPVSASTFRKVEASDW